LFATEAAAQYGGPSLLSRGGNRPGRRGRAPLDFSGYVGVRGTLDQGLIAPQVNEQGTVDPVTAYGWSAEAGVYGSHSWRRSSFGVDYRGDYRYTDKYKRFNGFNQALSLDYQHQFSARTSVFFQQIGGISNRAFGSFAAPAFGDLGRYGVPLNEVYDVRTYYLQSSATLAHRLSARTTIGAQGSGFFIKRSDTNLINSQGYTASGFLSYRLSQRTEIGGVYQFAKFEYPRVYTGADTHTLGFQLRRQLTRNWSIDGLFGVVRIAAFGTETVELSPEVAYILGTSQGVQAFERTVYRPTVQLTGSYTQDRGRFYGSYSSMIGGGNGVYMTSYMHTFNGGYSYSGIRRVSLGASAGYSRTESVTIALDNLEHYQAGVGGSYRLAEYVNLSGQLDYRIFNSPGLTGREGLALAIGLSYTPSRFPIPIW
jgi:hypothetical protein